MTDVSLGQFLPPPRMGHNYIRTISGRKFWPLNPRPEDVDIGDIAHALSLRCRYNSHVPYLYSVGQHSINVFYQSDGALWGLLHDAAEAYLPDVPRPIKGEFPFFNEIECRLLEVIAEGLGLSASLSEVHSARVRDADALVARYEYARFRPGYLALDKPGAALGGIPETCVLHFVDPYIVRARFLDLWRIQCG